MQLFIVNIQRFSLTNLCLEHVDLLDCAGVSLPDDRDDVDLLVDLLHHLHIQRLQAVACRSNEVEAGVHSEADEQNVNRMKMSLKSPLTCCP